jgi:hypothetical protein
MLAEIFLLVIVFYLLYRFVFNFLVPVMKTTRQVREQFRNMQNPGGQQQQQQEPQRPEPKSWQDRHTSTRGAAEDYIEFEEVKK